MGKLLICVLVGSLCFNFISCDYYKESNNVEFETNFQNILVSQIENDDFLKERLKFWTNNTTFSELKEHLGEPNIVLSMLSSQSEYEFIIINDSTEYTIRVTVGGEIISNVLISEYKTDGTGKYVRLEDSNDGFIKEKFAFLKKGITLPELKEHLGEPVKVDTTTDWITIYKFQIVNGETDYYVTTDVISNSVSISNVRIVASINGEPQKTIMWSAAE